MRWDQKIQLVDSYQNSGNGTGDENLMGAGPRRRDTIPRETQCTVHACLWHIATHSRHYIARPKIASQLHTLPKVTRRSFMIDIGL